MSATVTPLGSVPGAAPDLANPAGAKRTLGDDDHVENPSSPAEGKAFVEILQRHRVIQAETNEFLEKTVARPLSQGLAAMALKQPFDPVDYLVRWLRRYAENEERKKVLAAERAQLVKDRAEMKLKRKDELRVEAERATTYDSEGLTKEDRAVLDTLENTTWMSEKEFQRILDYLKSALGVKAAYMMQLYGEGDSSGAVLQYVGADSESMFLVDMTLKEDEGVVWDALPETIQPERSLSEDSADSESDDDISDEKEEKKESEAESESADNKDREAEGDQPKGRIGTPLIVADVMADERVKFWKMVRPGSLAAVSLIFEDPANKVNVDAMREYLIEVQNRERIIEEEESARKRAASTEHKKSLSRRSSMSSGLQSKRTTLGGEADLEADNSDEGGDYERRKSETEDDKEALPPPVAPPTYTYTTVKLVFCIDTLGMDERVSPQAVTRLSKFVEAIKKHCIRTRLAAVRAQAENSMDEEQRKERAYAIEKGLEKVETQAAPDIDAEKTLALERLEAKLQQEKEERVKRKQAQLKQAEDKKRRHFERKRAYVRRQQKKSEVSEEQQQSDAEGDHSEDAKDGEEELTDGRAEDDDEGPTSDRQRGTGGEDDEAGGEKTERESAEEESSNEPDKEEQGEDDFMEMLDPTFFLDEAEAKVKYEKTCEFVCQQYGGLLNEMENMFIPLTASAEPILAACLLLLGERPGSLRMNPKAPETDWDWQKMRSRLGTSFVQRLSSYKPADWRSLAQLLREGHVFLKELSCLPPQKWHNVLPKLYVVFFGHVPRLPPPSNASPAGKDTVLLYQIARIVEDLATLSEETMPLIEMSPALFLLERWVKTAVEYRLKYLTVTAATVLRDAKRNKRPPPRLETEVDIDFQDIPLPSVLLSTEA